MVQVKRTWIRLHARAFTLQLLRKRFVAGLMNSTETVELLQLGLQLINAILQLLEEKRKLCVKHFLIM